MRTESPPSPDGSDTQSDAARACVASLRASPCQGTEANNGVLIYVLWADHDIEIVADRGYNGRVSAREWSEVCHRMERLFGNGDTRQAAMEGVRAIGALIAQHFPSGGSRRAAEPGPSCCSRP